MLWLLGSGKAAAGERWVVCYSDHADSFELSAYDVVVLDSDRHPPLAPIVERAKTALAYLSLTQLGRGRAAFPELERIGVVLEAHPVWADAHFVDFRRPEWTRVVLEDVIPRALNAGFNGVFLDTLDDAEALEAANPVRFRGMRAALVSLVRAIRHHYPSIVLMANRGFGVMPQLASSIDILLGESVMTTFDTVTKAYLRRKDDDIAWQVQALRHAREVNPQLRVFTLDYWDPEDRAGVARLYRDERALGFSPYVSTPMLDYVIREPR